MKWKRSGSCLAVLGIVFAMNARAQTLDDAAPPTIKEDDRRAPVDRGYGPGVLPNNDIRAVQEMMAAPAAAPVGGADAQTKGVFGPPVTWPIIAIHAVLLPDGRVMNYGTANKVSKAPSSFTTSGILGKGQAPRRTRCCRSFVPQLLPLFE